MKKTAKKTPAVAAAKPAPAKTVTAKAAVPAAPKAEAKAPAKKVAAATKAKPVAQIEPPVTTISARIDISFGNHLYLRGEGPGLSWDHGLAMDSASADLWTTTLKGATGPITFKVLVNDLTWSAGADYVVEPGQSLTIVPTF